MLELANRLRDIDSDTAPLGLRARSLLPHTINDSFDLAEALLRGDSLATALRARNRSELLVLRAIAEDGRAGREQLRESTRLGTAELDAALQTLSELFLIAERDGEISCYEEVAVALTTANLPSLADLAQQPAPVALANSQIDTSLLDRSAVETAMGTVAAVAELVRELEREPARELSKGGLTLPDLRRLAGATHRDLDEQPALLALASQAGLCFREGQLWLAAVEAEAWLTAEAADRWAGLALPWWRAVPAAVRGVAEQWAAEPARETTGLSRLGELLDWRYPAIPNDDVKRMLDCYAAEAQALGLLAGSELSLPGKLLASGRGDAGFAAQVAGLLPPTVDRVYLQPDLSIIVPGPATARLDQILRRFADVERADLASSYRLSATSINRALSTGMTAAEIRTVLDEISLTGIPQPAQYLLDDASAKFGKIRVREAGAADLPLLSSIRSTDAHALDALLVDHTLSALGLSRVEDGRVLSRASAQQVLWMLSEAKYPAALEDAGGQIIPLTVSLATARTPADSIDPVQAMWTRVRTSLSAATEGTAWLNRQVQGAMRAKTPLLVEVRLPGGGSAEYLLEPTGLSNNRMRARDRRTEIERTLPLSSIMSLRDAELSQDN